MVVLSSVVSVKAISVLVYPVLRRYRKWKSASNPVSSSWASASVTMAASWLWSLRS